MRRLFFAMLWLVIGPSAWAQTIDRVEIVEHGIYTADTLRSQRDSIGQLHSTIGNVHLVESTTTVPADTGVRFGIKFEVIGQPDGQKVPIRKVMVYPPPGLRSPNAPGPLLRSEEQFSPTIGETVFTGFAFDDPWEMVPGTWTIQLWQGDRLLAEQSFTVVALKST